jgi:glucose-1-phosphatase
MIRAIVFDFGNVICRFDNRIILDRFAKHTGRPADELERIIYRESDITTLYESGTITSEDFFERLSSLIGLEMPREEFVQAYTDKFTPIPETFSLVRTLAGRYRLGLLSNTSAWDFERGIVRTEIFHHFSAASLSYAVRSLKPDRAIYDDMLSQLAANPGEVIYIDDIAAYVDAARALGMQGIHFLSSAQLIDSLKRFGIGGIG